MDKNIVLHAIEEQTLVEKDSFISNYPLYSLGRK
jgi:hypothetical protein